ncbi:hypothetical protein D3C71_1976370 [compost metagenome]
MRAKSRAKMPVTRRPASPTAPRTIMVRPSTAWIGPLSTATISAPITCPSAVAMGL